MSERDRGRGSHTGTINLLVHPSPLDPLGPDQPNLATSLGRSLAGSNLWLLSLPYNNNRSGWRTMLHRNREARMIFSGQPRCWMLMSPVWIRWKGRTRNLLATSRTYRPIEVGLTWKLESCFPYFTGKLTTVLSCQYRLGTSPCPPVRRLVLASCPRTLLSIHDLVDQLDPRSQTQSRDAAPIRCAPSRLRADERRQRQ
jgi:hypothetical protein